ncbi:Mut7-C RNAse domain-containing protein [Massilia sp. Leaf139]|uniref:Mut7-C RNAse domain-containing protein n=1 Tax=Massilia sp. Leaf139 TaxID=1736272 RepID=UPI0006FCA1F8|nr:Mut7-C RNAse domain-containing protein [Massilia sp. Leaf139]KQQ86395.1 twitching motility protein PilT [Massilia sp. Leaf139]
MVTARFRFFGELNDFLPRTRRGAAFTTGCARAATVKHMIEALGVPHTEAGQVLVNGVPARFERLLEEGDAVEVRPQREDTEPGIRFIADAHLGGLARLLRMAGFDTLYDNSWQDEALAAIAGREGRTVLTRDRELLKRRELGRGCYLHTIRPEAQLRELFERLTLALHARPFTLCLHCNLPLRPVAKDAVRERLPESVRQTHSEFTTCDNCDRVFWKGSHHRRMLAMLGDAIGLKSPSSPSASENA